MGAVPKGFGRKIWSARSARMLQNSRSDISEHNGGCRTVGVTSASVSLVSPLVLSARTMPKGRSDISERVARESPCTFGTESAERGDVSKRVARNSLCCVLHGGCRTLGGTTEGDVTKHVARESPCTFGTKVPNGRGDVGELPIVNRFQRGLSGEGEVLGKFLKIFGEEIFGDRRFLESVQWQSNFGRPSTTVITSRELLFVSPSSADAMSPSDAEARGGADVSRGESIPKAEATAEEEPKERADA
ncbi:Hypothetical predicted protein [Prunus dulcis]|uniref:Uncharacterized protein n=1 Tax=Prunus dulcis TaxID=3755 RepID=A0A5E4ERY4_PRUDU|nr:Hypothetical predicted protein [Prunus dulcis]